MRPLRLVSGLLRLGSLCAAAAVALYGQGTCPSSGAPVVVVSANPSTLQAGQTATLRATVTCYPIAQVTWSASPSIGILGANSPASGITTTNTYTAPATFPSGTQITITITASDPANTTATTKISLGQTLDVGVGAPTSFLQAQFLQAYNRNGFSSKVSLPPSGAVTTLGSSGYVQVFADASKNGTVWALASQSSTTAGSSSDGTVTYVVQIWGGLYSYFSSLGVNTVGYPLYDTASCGTVQGSACIYQLFDKGYALFDYSPGLSGGANLNIDGTFYTLWTNTGGVGGLGPPLTAQTSITASTSTTATAQTYSSGAIYSITSGAYKGQTFVVAEPLYDAYVAQNGPNGILGVPISKAVTLATGGIEQFFEGGALSSASGIVTTQLPIGSIALNGVPVVSAGQSIALNQGNTLTLTAVPYDTAGNPDVTRPVSWNTSNSQVVSIQASGQTAVLTAAGPGSANVTATSGGATSVRLSFVVIAPCCQVGDGTPAAVEQSFQNALARNKLTAVIPVGSPAVREGSGYIQTVSVVTTGGMVQVLIAESDQSGTAYVVSGAVLAKYLAMNGPLGSLGYPTSDQSAGGTQLFANNTALGGNPVYEVSGPILAKWAAGGYETGPAGAPASDPSAFSTFAASSGTMQNFANGTIYAATAGPRAGQAYFVSAAILASYMADGGPAGELGMPISDVSAGGTAQQSFEGGTITLAAGTNAASINAAPRIPTVIASPSTITAGGTVHLAVFGFANNSTVRVSLTGQPDFLMTSTNGAYSWSMYIPLTAASGTVAIHAADTHAAASTADGAITIRGFSNTRAQLNKVGGDNQSGSPGALLTAPLTVSLTDASGNPVIGAAVTFEGSPGVQLSTSSAVTDSNGSASTQLRLPGAKGVAGVTARSSLALAPVTFAATASPSALSNFPNWQQSGSAQLGNGTATIAQKGALLTAVASILAYHQNRGDVAAPNGAATPAALNQFLISDCTANSKGVQLCDGYLSNPTSGEQVVNLWRAADFTGGVDVTTLAPTAVSLADYLSMGEPLLVSLNLTLNGSAAGGHFVTAIGVNADGSIAIQDPSPLLARTNLNDYLNGFSGAQGTWQGSLAGVVRFAVGGHSATRFLLGGISQAASLMSVFTLSAISPAGACGLAVDLVDTVDSSGNLPAHGPLISRMEVCDGLQPTYQIDIGASQNYGAFVTDLSAGGSRFDLSGSAPASYSATRPQLNLLVEPQSAAFTAAGVVNSATFTAGIAPGALFSIFGSGLAALCQLSGPCPATSVDFDGTTAEVIAATSFQVNAQVPPAMGAGQHALRVRSPFGTASQTVMVSQVAPAIFLLGNGISAAVENQDYSMNSSTNPAARGNTIIVYATGLGAVSAGGGGLSTVNSTVTALVNGAEIPVSYAGLTPGFAGLYQVNVPIPVSIAPGLGIFLTLKEGGQVSNSVNISLQ